MKQKFQQPLNVNICLTYLNTGKKCIFSFSIIWKKCNLARNLFLKWSLIGKIRTEITLK